MSDDDLRPPILHSLIAVAIVGCVLACVLIAGKARGLVRRG